MRIEFDKHMKKAGGHIGRNVVENNNNNKDEDNCPKILNDKDQYNINACSFH